MWPLLATHPPRTRPSALWAAPASPSAAGPAAELLLLAPLSRHSSLLRAGSAGALHLLEEKRSLLSHIYAHLQPWFGPCLPPPPAGFCPHTPQPGHLADAWDQPVASFRVRVSLPTVSALGSVAPGFCSHCPHGVQTPAWCLSWLCPDDYPRSSLISLRTPLGHPANDRRPPLATEFTPFLGSSSVEMASPVQARNPASAPLSPLPRSHSSAGMESCPQHFLNVSRTSSLASTPCPPSSFHRPHPG